MDTLAFLRHVLPTTGPYCIARQINRPDGSRTYYHYAAADLDEAVAIARREEARPGDIFFAVGALIKGRIWDEKKQHTRVPRDATNIRGLRSYILDIDIGDGGQYPTVPEALMALKKFVKSLGLPKPTIVSSGGGLHVYFTVDDEVPPAEWKSYGALLKQAAEAEGLRIDPNRTADCASVLRVVGTHNYKPKYSTPLLVETLLDGVSIPTADLHKLLTLRAGSTVLVGTSVAEFGSNTNLYEPSELSFPLMIERCIQFAAIAHPENQKQGRDKVPEPLWMHAIQLCTHMHNGRKAAHRISMYDPRYSEAYVDEKFDYLANKQVGPTKCVTFQNYNAIKGLPDGCAGCPSYGKITSPAQITRYHADAPPIIVSEVVDGQVVEREVEIPPLPDDYQRTSNGIGIKIANAKTGANDLAIFSPYDMYPVRLRFNERTLLEDDVEWAVKLPKEGWVSVHVPQGTPPNQLKSVLARRGMYIDGHNIAIMDTFMTAYMRKLQNEIARERAINKFGWRQDGGFALGGTIYLPNGSQTTHTASKDLLTATSNGVHEAGTLDGWRNHIMMYNRPGLAGYRSILYSSFGSPLYAFTGQLATFVSAMGDTGVGKSTLLDASAAVWGDPRAIVVRGTKHGSTRTAAEVITDALHNLPLCMDEIGDRDPQDMAEFIFNYSGGRGKARGKATGGLREDTATWANLALANGNKDEYERMLEVSRDGAQHMVRLIQLTFESSTAISKDEGDAARTAFWENYGHAGRAYAEYIATRQGELKRTMVRYTKEMGAAINATSAERFWVAWVAAAKLGGEIAVQLGLLPNFPIEQDVLWMLNQVKSLRVHINGVVSNGAEILAEFLESAVPNTLSISTKASNINNIINAPRGDLQVRHEVDNHIIVVSNTAFRTYCAQHAIGYTRVMAELRKNRIFLAEDTLRTLGAMTPYAKGQVRCMVIDLKKIGGALQLAPPVPQQAAATP